MPAIISTKIIVILLLFTYYYNNFRIDLEGAVWICEADSRVIRCEMLLICLHQPTTRRGHY
jgi:hypothetical protein